MGLKPTGRFISVQQAARRWNVSENTIRRLILENKLSGIKVRRSYGISYESVLEYEKEFNFDNLEMA